MGPYTIPIDRPTCRCGKRATVRVFNRVNAHVGNACARCAKRMIAELDTRRSVRLLLRATGT